MKGSGLAVVALAGVGVLLLSSGKAEAVTMPLPLPSPLPPRVPPSAPAGPVPPITTPPNGRHLSPEEKAVLSPYIPKVDLDETMLWWNTPASSFSSEDPNVYVIALTTARGIYLRDPNHAIVTPYEFSILAHELVHAGQYRTGAHLTKAEMELPAYQMQVQVKNDLDRTLNKTPGTSV